MDSAKNCPFCLENGLLRGNILFQDDVWYFVDLPEGAIQNAGMAITKRHIETPFDINQVEWAKLHELLPKFKSLIDDVKKPDGYNLGWNVAKSGGQNVPHAHLHIVARYDDEPLAGLGIRHHFKQPNNKRKTQE